MFRNNQEISPEKEISAHKVVIFLEGTVFPVDQDWINLVNYTSVTKRFWVTSVTDCHNGWLFVIIIFLFQFQYTTLRNGK